MLFNSTHKANEDILGSFFFFFQLLSSLSNSKFLLIDACLSYQKIETVLLRLDAREASSRDILKRLELACWTYL